MSNDSNKNRGVVTGTSTRGNLQEALDNAVRQIGHGVPWRLAAIDGLQGGFVGDVVNVHIYSVVQAPGKDGGVSGEEPGGEEPGGGFEVPTSRAGLVEDIRDQVSICQDGAQWELVSQSPEGEQRLRLATGNREVERVLNDAAGTRQQVRVSGYIRRVECERMDVYDATPADAPITTL